MKANQDFHWKNPDLYEEILASESLDPYEGLLNNSKGPKKYRIDMIETISPHTPTTSSNEDQFNLD